jgi:hypothetical protein
MPATPYHFGPSTFVALTFRKWLDAPVFILANVIVDMERLVVIIVFGLGRLMHSYAHTLLIGAVVGIIWALATYPARPLFAKLMQILCIPYKTNLLKTLIPGVLGVWFHPYRRHLPRGCTNVLAEQCKTALQYYTSRLDEAYMYRFLFRGNYSLRVCH